MRTASKTLLGVKQSSVVFLASNFARNSWYSSSSSRISPDASFSSNSLRFRSSSFSSSSSLDFSKPKSTISKSLIPSNSILSFSKSHEASSPTLLSASLNAFICCSVRSSAIMHGIVLSLSFFAALTLVCPATITFSLSITTGTLNPNSLILAATASTASSLFLGLFT